MKKQRNFTARKHHDFRRFSENDLLNKIARIFLIFEMCGSIPRHTNDFYQEEVCFYADICYKME